MFILGILIILCIARYNESNKLFWTLFTAFTLGFAATKVLYDTFKEKEQSEVSLNQACPTQALFAVENAFVSIFENTSNLESVKNTSNLVGKVTTPDYVEHIVTLSDVPGVTHGIYLHNLPNPPNSVTFFNTS